MASSPASPRVGFTRSRIEADVTANSPAFTARLAKHQGKKLTKFDLNNEASAQAARAAVQAGSFKVHAVEKKPGRNEPCSCGSGKKYKVCCGA